MTKQDFQLIADIIRCYEFKDPKDRSNLAQQFARYLKHTNIRFDQGLFIEAATRPIV